MREDDIPRILKLEAACFPHIPSERYWKPEMLEAHVQKFPEGQFVVERDGRLVASATSLRVRLEDALRPHTWRGIAGRGYLSTHVADGEALYGTEVMVHPDARRGGVARRLYRLRKDLIRRENMRCFVAGGRIPGYHKVAKRMTAAEYVREVVDEWRTDKTLTSQLRAGMTVTCLMPEYMMDPDSLNWATLLVWWNLDYEAATPSPREIQRVD